MFRKLAAVLAISAAFVTAGQAAEISSDEAAFTTYVQQKLQLYSPSPINLVGPLSLSVGPSSTAIDLPSLKPVHDLCLASPSKCERAVNDFVQDTVRSILQKPSPHVAAVALIQTQLVACNRTSRALQLASVYVPVTIVCGAAPDGLRSMPARAEAYCKRRIRSFTLAPREPIEAQCTIRMSREA